jgi:dihydroflavonol-4-reductase
MIDARDVAAGMIAAMEIGKPGRRYLLGFRNLQLGEWLTMVGRAVGRSVPKWKVPYWLALATAYASEFIADHITGQMPNATVTGVKLTRHVMHFDPTASLAVLNLRPRPIEEAARDAVEWYRSMNWI